MVSAGIKDVKGFMESIASKQTALNTTNLLVKGCRQRLH